MRIVRLNVNGEMIGLETQCNYGIDKIVVTAFTGEGISSKPDGLTMEDFKKLEGETVELCFAINDEKDDKKYTLESLGKWRCKGTFEVSDHSDFKKYAVQFKYEHPKYGKE